MQSFSELDAFIARGRKGHSRRLSHNEYAQRRGDDCIEHVLYYTPIITYYRDGRIELRHGGWTGPVTRRRMPHTVTSINGEWHIARRASHDDQRPPWIHRTIMPPFVTPDPGPEPVKDPAGCKAETIEYAMVKQHVRVGVRELSPNELHEELTADRRWRHMPTARSAHYVQRMVEESTLYIEDYATWARAKDGVDHVEQCPHCKAFGRVHNDWEHAHHRGAKSYTVMLDMLDRFGDVKGWREAATVDYHAVRLSRRLYREWEQRNYEPFVGAVEVDCDGYARCLTNKERKAEAVARRRQEVVDKLAKRRAQRHDNRMKRIRGELTGVPIRMLGRQRLRLDNAHAKLLLTAVTRYTPTAQRTSALLDWDVGRATIGPLKDRRIDLVSEYLNKYILNLTDERVLTIYKKESDA